MGDLVDVRGQLHRHLFGSRARKRGFLISTGVVTTVGTALLVGLMPASADTTNGDRIAFPASVCTALLAGSPIIQLQDLAVQAVVPNTVATSAPYASTIPGGTAELPATGGGYPINELKNIGQIYLFRSSSGTPQITNTVANGGATNNGNPVTFTTSFTNQGTTIPITAAAWSSSPGGVITYTTGSPHGLAKNQLVDETGFGKAAYNASGALVGSVPTSTTFTRTGKALPIANAVWTAGNSGEITFTTSVRHGLAVGNFVTATGNSPARYNRNVQVTAIPSPTSFVVPGGATDPGPIVTKNQVWTLGNPGASGTTLGSVSTLTTAVATTASAQPGSLTVPDVTVSMTAPATNATVTSYGGAVTVTANLQTGAGPIDADTVCEVPHATPQADGISATLVGTGGPTTTSNPICRPPDVCATTTTTLPAAPTVTSVTPNSGTTSGGTSVTIAGTNLTGATAVSFGATAASTFTVNNANQITVTAPAHAAGTVDVTAITPGGTSATNTGDQYTYVAGPTVTSVTPSSGPTAGGTSVTIAGTGFTGATAVSFGGTAASTFTVDNASQITATAPAHAAGTVDVTVTTPAGTSPTGAADQYTYVAAPTVTSITPSSGPTVGGTSVTIAGTNLTGASAVSFGGTAATTFTVDNANQITATAPAHAAGAVDVTVTTAGGTSATNLGDAFTYVAAPTVTSVTPSSGPTTGGTSVTIAGTNLTGASAVSFGGTAATTFTVDNANQITATAPAHAAGAVDVTVTTIGGTSATSANDQFTYNAVASGCGTSCIVVGDKAILETNALTKTIQIPVTLSQPATQEVTVHYTVTDGSATGGTKADPGIDYKLKSGTLTFKPSINTGLTPITKTIAVTVFADTGTETDETVKVTLDTPTGGGYIIGPGTGTGTCGSTSGCATGTILNDDGGPAGFTLGVGDGSIFSARSGKQTNKLPVTLSEKATTTVTVDYVVLPGSATWSMKSTEGGDYGGKTSGTLTFAPGQTLKQIASPIHPDAVAEADQSYTVVLSNVNGNGTGVSIIRVTGTGTILGLT